MTVLRFLTIFFTLLIYSCDFQEEEIVVYDYDVVLPKNYNANKEWPLLVFLHGAGSFTAGKADLLAYFKLNDNPFIIVIPRSSRLETETKAWEPDQVVATLDQIIGFHPIDQRRIYMTGISAGGFGTLRTAAAFPLRFTALAPISGGIEIQLVESLEVSPIWFFHNIADNIVSYGDSFNAYTKLKKVSSLVKITTYPLDDSPSFPHNAWTTTYQNPELYKWFLSHKSVYLATDL